MTKTAFSPLSRFSKGVVANRQAHFRQIRSLPPEFGKTLARHYKSRLARAQGKPLLGEYAPWLLADMLPLRNPNVAHEVAPAWMSLYAYTLFVDDMLDSPRNEDFSRSFLAGSLLLERGLSAMSDALPKQAKIRVKLDQYFLEAAQATFREIEQHRKKVEEYDESEVAALGEKVALLKLCASCLLAADGISSISEELLVPVESLATGAQLFDDITDWEEDWQNGNYTYLLTKTFQTLSRDGIKRLPSEFEPLELLAGMVITGSLEDSLARGLEYLKTVEAAPHLQKASRAGELLGQLIRENAAFRDEVTQARRSLEGVRTSHLGRKCDWIRELMLNEPVKKQTFFIYKRIQILAQST